MQDAISPRRFNAEAYLFGPQLDFVRDTSKYKTAVCSRRAGKTVGCAVSLLDTAMRRPGTVNLYITRSRVNAKRIVWRRMQQLIRDHRLGAEANETESSLRFPNESVIYLVGAKDRDKIEDYRGMPLAKVVLDESQAFPPYFKELVDDVLEPALMDFDGSMELIGTPSPVPVGYFYEACKSKQWSHHEWTVFQNPWIEKQSGKTPQQHLAAVLERRGVTVDDPSIQREWFGRWVLDVDALVFKYDAARNAYRELPKDLDGKWSYVIGIDVGFGDADAVAVLAYNSASPKVWLKTEHVQPKQTISDLIAVVKKEYQDLGPRNVAAVVMDPAGMGQKLIEELAARHGVPCEAAKKADKQGHIELLNDALRTSLFFARPDSRFAADTQLVEWDKDKSKADRRVVSERFHSDICFPAGTLVSTEYGTKPIEEIEAGELIWTRAGLRPVIQSAYTGVKTVMSLLLENGMHLVGTENHPVWSQRGWVRLSDLLASDSVLYCAPWIGQRAATKDAIGRVSVRDSAKGITPNFMQAGGSRPFAREGVGANPKWWSGAARFGGAGRRPLEPVGGNTSSARASICTEPSGSRLMALSRQECISIIETAIPPTTTSPIWNALGDLNISGIIRHTPAKRASASALPVSPRPGMPLRRGTHQKPAGNGIASTAGNPGRTVLSIRTPVSFAERNSRLALEMPRYVGATALLSSDGKAGSMTSTCSARSAAARSSGIATPDQAAAPVHVRAVERRANAVPVYGLSIAGEHEYFANGVLVKNCDAVLYAYVKALAWVHKPKESVPAPGTKEAYEREQRFFFERERQRILEEKAEQQEPFGPASFGDWGIG